MRHQAGPLSTALRSLLLHSPLVVYRLHKLNTHFNQARKDIEGITTAAERAGKRAHKLDNFDFEEIEASENVVPLTKP